jgi:hypothetical protein
MNLFQCGLKYSHKGERKGETANVNVRICSAVGCQRAPLWSRALMRSQAQIQRFGKWYQKNCMGDLKYTLRSLNAVQTRIAAPVSLLSKRPGSKRLMRRSPSLSQYHSPLFGVSMGGKVDQFHFQLGPYQWRSVPLKGCVGYQNQRPLSPFTQLCPSSSW